jgi:hypothetical protein
VLERDRDENAFRGSGPAAELESNFSFIASSTAVVSGDVWRGDIEGLADSDFSLIPLSNTVVSGDVWGAPSSALLWAAAASTMLNTDVQTEITARFSFI